MNGRSHTTTRLKGEGNIYDQASPFHVFRVASQVLPGLYSNKFICMTYARLLPTRMRQSRSLRKTDLVSNPAEISKAGGSRRG